MIERPEGFQIWRFCVRPGRPVVRSAAEPDASEFRNASYCRGALPRPNDFCSGGGGWNNWRSKSKFNSYFSPT